MVINIRISTIIKVVVVLGLIYGSYRGGYKVGVQRAVSWMVDEGCFEYWGSQVPLSRPHAEE